MTNQTALIEKLVARSGLKGNDLKRAIRSAVKAVWPNLPPWSTLEGPEIEEVQKATVGSGIVVTFMEDGIRKVLLGAAGENYKRPDHQGPWPVLYTIPGGFINLTKTSGSSLVAPSDQPENPRVGAARETEEEFKKIDGSPLLKIDPARLKPADTVTIAFPSGEKRVVIGFMLELAADEVCAVRKHVNQMAADTNYRKSVAAQTLNPATHLPEINNLAVVPLQEMVDGKHRLLHQDQASLFRAVHNYFDSGPGF